MRVERQQTRSSILPTLSLTGATHRAQALITRPVRDKDQFDLNIRRPTMRTNAHAISGPKGKKCAPATGLKSRQP